jgi:DNA-binding NtrC family response regulator
MTGTPSGTDGPDEPSSPRLAARRVLVAEDDRRLRGMLVASLTDMGLEPTAAGSGEAAWQLAAGSPFAVAVVDLNLPGMSGLDLCERLRAARMPVELVILTGFGDLEAARRAIRLEVVDFLTKPCGMDELEQAVTRARVRWLDRWIDVAVPPTPPPDATPAAPTSTAGQRSIDDAERALILAALARHGGNREAAATEVGISLRKLYYRLNQYQRADRQRPAPPAD